MQHPDSSIFVLGSFVVSCSAKVWRLPRAGESLRADAFTLEAGGKGFNIAVGAHRLGASVDGLFAVGDDPFGHLAAPAFARAGLSPGMLHVCAGATTGGGIGFTDADGENCLAVFSGANDLLSPEAVRSASGLRRARLAVAQFESPDAPIREAFEIARTCGATTLLNPSPFRPIDAQLLRRTSILVMNRTEAASCARAYGSGPERDDVSDPAVAGQIGTRLLDLGPEIVVITLGAEGAVACRLTMVTKFMTACLAVLFAASFAAAPVDAKPVDKKKLQRLTVDVDTGEMTEDGFDDTCFTKKVKVKDPKTGKMRTKTLTIACSED